MPTKKTARAQKRARKRARKSKPPKRVAEKSAAKNAIIGAPSVYLSQNQIVIKAQITRDIGSDANALFATMLLMRKRAAVSDHAAALAVLSAKSVGPTMLNIRVDE